MNIAFLLTVSQLYNRMSITNRFTLIISPLRLHSASSVRIPHSINNLRSTSMLPSVSVRPINLFSVASVNFSGAGNTNMFTNNLRIKRSPLKSPILRKYTNSFKRSGMYPNISKWYAKRCRCCSHLCTASTVSSSINGRSFSVVNMSDFTWKSTDLIYVITWRAANCKMQYVEQTNRMLKIRFNEHYRRMSKPKQTDTFLYRHFKRTGHSLNYVSIQPVEKIYYDVNSTASLKLLNDTKLN